MSSADTHVLITGLGAVTPLGVGVPAFTRSLREGASGIALLDFEHPQMKSTVGALCRDFEPARAMSEADLARLPRLVPMALCAAQEALRRAGMSQPDSRHVGLILGTGGGGIDFTLDQAAAHWRGERPSLWTITNATHGNLAGELSIRLGFKGPSLCVSNGCASSSDALGIALEALRSTRPGAPDAMVVIGADAHVRYDTLLSMELLRVVSVRNFRNDPAGAPTASRPFDRSRDGFVLGEGAWAAVLEREAHAEVRGARAVGRLLGYGATCDAYHRVRPDPDMTESARAIREAVEDSGLAIDEIEAVHYHGTATPLNDALETKAIKSALGSHAKKVPGSSVKGAIGHPQGACGMAALVATLASLTAQDGGTPFLLPTINLREPDDACDLDYTPRVARPTAARTALINCLAFGAKNSAIVVRAEPCR